MRYCRECGEWGFLDLRTRCVHCGLVVGGSYTVLLTGSTESRLCGVPAFHHSWAGSSPADRTCAWYFSSLKGVEKEDYKPTNRYGCQGRLRLGARGDGPTWADIEALAAEFAAVRQAARELVTA